MDLGKVKEVLEKAEGLLDFHGHKTDYIEEALAELDKPVDEDAMSIARFWLNEAINTERVEKLAVDIQQYAESYHAKKCAEVLSSSADRAMAVYARDCEGCSPRLSDDCDEQCPYIAKIRKAIMEEPCA